MISRAPYQWRRTVGTLRKVLLSIVGYRKDSIKLWRCRLAIHDEIYEMFLSSSFQLEKRVGKSVVCMSVSAPLGPEKLDSNLKFVFYEDPVAS